MKDFITYNWEKLKLSKNLQIIENSDKVLIYHTLFGMPMIFDKDILKLFLKFKNWENIKTDEVNEEDLKFLQDIFFVLNFWDDDRKIFNEKITALSKNVKNWKDISKLDLLISEACNLWCQHCIYFNSVGKLR
jgi:hypothetical protein